MIEISFPDKATMYQSPCASCGKGTVMESGPNGTPMVTCDKFLCYEVNEFSEKHPSVSISST